MKPEVTKEMKLCYIRGVKDVLRLQLGREPSEKEFNEVMRQLMFEINE
jgi:uncharacterized protein YneF (UPF0154 family)